MRAKNGQIQTTVWVFHYLSRAQQQNLFTGRNFAVQCRLCYQVFGSAQAQVQAQVQSLFDRKASYGNVR